MGNSIFLKDNQDFITFGFQHLLTLLFFVFAGFFLIKWAKKLPSEKQFKIGYIFAWSLSFAVILWTFLKVYQNGFDIEEDLPFHLCNLMALVLPFIAKSRNKTIHYVLYFWILAATTHSLITPSETNGFPNFRFIKYWYVHAGLVIYSLYTTIVYKFYPTFKSVFIAYAGFVGYLILMFLLNGIIGSNYFYTNRKPDSASALDLFGEYPTYIFVVVLFLIPYFLIFYLPIYLRKKKKSI